MITSHLIRNKLMCVGRSVIANFYTSDTVYHSPFSDLRADDEEAVGGRGGGGERITQAHANKDEKRKKNTPPPIVFSLCKPLQSNCVVEE